MTDLALALLVLSGIAAIYYVNDGRIRVAVTAALAGLLVWRNYSKNSSSSNPPEIPDSSPLEHAATELHEADDAIADTIDTLDPVTADDVDWADAVRRTK
jgi:hypothetical protein